MATEVGQQDNKGSSEEKVEHPEKTRTALSLDRPRHNVKHKNRKRSGAGNNRKKNLRQAVTDKERNCELYNSNTSDEEKRDSGKEEKENEPEEQTEGSEEYDPLKVDFFERLQLEGGSDPSDLVCLDNYSVQDLQTAFKKLANSERQFYAMLMTLLGGIVFAMVFGLFVLQVQMSSNSREILTTHVQRLNKEIPKRLHSLYFDYLDSSMMPDTVDLRANTTIFVH